MKKNKKDKNIRVHITDENELEYWKQYKKTKDFDIRSALIVKYSPLVKYVAGKISLNISSHKSIEFCDLVGYGTLGLIDAIEKYDPEREIKFKTYAVTRIRGAIFDELRAIDPLSRTIRQKAKAIEETRHRLEARYGRNIRGQEVADAMGIDIQEHNKVMKYLHESSPVSLNHVCYVDDSDEISIEDMLKSTEKVSPDYIVEREEIRKIIANALYELPEKEKQVLILYYYEDLTLKEIGAVLDVSESRISQLHTKATQALRYQLSEIKKNLI